MGQKLICMLLAAALMAPGIVGAVTEEDFLVKTTQDLVDLCTATIWPKTRVRKENVWCAFLILHRPEVK